MVTQDSLVGWFFQDGYLYDWLGAAIAIIINLVVPGAIGTRDRAIIPNDPTLSYPLTTNTISSAVLYVLTFVFPGIVIVTGAAIQRSFADGHHGLLSLAEGFALCCGWKRWMNLVGRLRPDWFQLVLSDPSSSKLDDGRMAYPSGHSAYMFFSATIITCWLMGKMKLLAVSSRGLFFKLVVCLMPLWLATFVACTRLADYKHDFSDVNAGCFIGIATGLIGYFLNYHSLFCKHCHLPKLRTRLSALHSEPPPSWKGVELPHIT